MAGETDAERLIVLLEARIRDFEKNMQKASGTADRNYDRMRRGSKSATREMEADMARSTSRINHALASTSTQIGALGRTFAGAFAGGIFAGGLTGVVSGVRNLVRETASLADEAARAGLSLQVFQEWKAVAEDTRIPLDAIVDAFKELNIRADEFATTGKGSAADAFARLGMDPQDVQRRLKDPSAFMLELIRRTRLLGDTAAATRIFDELFGGTGAEQAVRLLQLADGEIQNMIDSAHETGRVLDDEIIKKAGEIDREFATAWRNFETNAKRAVLAVLPHLQSLDDRAEQLFKNIPVVRLYNYLAGNSGGADAGGDPVQTLQTRVDFLTQHIEALRAKGEDALSAERQLAQARAALEQEVQRIMGGQGRGEIGSTEKPTTLPRITVDDDKPARRDQAAAAANREMEAVNALINSLSHELSLIGESEVVQAQLNARRQAGAAATEEQLSQIDMLVEAIHREKEAHEQAQEAAEARKDALEDLFQRATDGLLSLAEGSGDAEDAVKRLVVQLAQAVLQAALLGTGPFGGMFGGGLLGSSRGLNYFPPAPSAALPLAGRSVTAAQPARAVPGAARTAQPASGAASGPNVAIRVEVVDRAGVKVEAGPPRRESGGELSLPIIINQIEDRMVQSMNSGKLGRAAQSTYGLKRITR